MNRRTLIKALAFLIVPAAAARQIGANRSLAANSWVSAGKIRLAANSQTARIVLGRRAVALTQMKIAVEGNGLWIYRAVLHHGPASSTAIPIDLHVPPGRSTSPLSISNATLPVQAVSLDYANLPFGPSATSVEVWGLAAR